MANILATLFGGPLDGKVVEIEHAARFLKFPHKKGIVQHVKEGGKLPRAISSLTYELEMWTGDNSCMYTYKKETTDA